MKRKDFYYTKADGSVTERSVIVVHDPSDLMLAIDVSEFSEAEREFTLGELEVIQAAYMASITEIGLKGKWRTFKKEGISAI